VVTTIHGHRAAGHRHAPGGSGHAVFAGSPAFPTSTISLPAQPGRHDWMAASAARAITRSGPRRS